MPGIYSILHNKSYTVRPYMLIMEYLIQIKYCLHNGVNIYEQIPIQTLSLRSSFSHLCRLYTATDDKCDQQSWKNVCMFLRAKNYASDIPKLHLCLNTACLMHHLPLSSPFNLPPPLHVVNSTNSEAPITYCLCTLCYFLPLGAKYRQSPTFAHISILKTCTKVKQQTYML